MNLKFMKNKRERAEKVHIADMPRDDRRSPYMRMHFYPGMCAEVQGKFNVFFPGIYLFVVRIGCIICPCSTDVKKSSYLRIGSVCYGKFRKRFTHKSHAR